MRIIARLWILMWICAFLTIAFTAGGGCSPAPPEPGYEVTRDASCPKGITHDECVQYKFFRKYPGMRPWK